MGKYINSIKELVAKAVYDSENLKTAASQNEANACFQIGMACLFGAVSDVDFPKAKQYLGDSSLAKSDEALRLLGFIAECEGNIGDAFSSYVKAFDSDGKKTNVEYFDKVIKQRDILSKEFDSLSIKGVEWNNNITRLLDSYKKHKLTKADMFVLLAMVQKDEASCLEAANSLLEKGEAYAAKRWFERSGAGNKHPLFSKIENKINETRLRLNLSVVPEVIELESNNLTRSTENTFISTFYDSISENMGSYYTSLWKDVASQTVALVKKELDAEEEERIKKQKAEEAARIKKQQEEEARRREQMLKEQEELRKQQEEEKKRRRKKIKLALPFVIFVVAMLINLTRMTPKDAFSNAFALVVSCCTNP